MTASTQRAFFVVLLALAGCLWAPAMAQSNWQRQQQQQQQQQQQMQQQQQRQQMQDQQRQQMQQQQRQQMQEQQRQQMQAQQRQQMQEQQRQQMQSQQRQQMQTQQQQQQRQQMQTQQQRQTADQQRQQMQRQGAMTKDGKPTGVVVSGGTARMARPLTPGEIQKGFTGRVTADGRALIKYQGRIFTVPASRVAGLSARLAKQRADRQAASAQSASTTQRLAAISAAGGGSGREPPSSNVSGTVRGQLLGSVSPVAVAARLEAAQLARLQERGFKDDSVGAMRNPNADTSTSGVTVQRKVSKEIAGARVAGAYDYANRGPLPDRHAQTFAGHRYEEVLLTRETTFFRAYGGKAGPKGADGTYVTPNPQSGGIKSQIDSGLDPSWGNTANRLAKIVVPAGTKIYVGESASQGGVWVGGTSQVYIPPDAKIEVRE